MAAIPSLPIVGCRVPVSKINEGETLWISAEVLGVRFQDSETPQYYVHFDQYNKRLDEWITVDRMDLSKMKLPSPRKKPALHSKVNKLKSNKSSSDKKRKRPSDSLLSQIHSTPISAATEAATPSTLGDSGAGEEGESAQAESTFSKEKEIEKLRTSGSMTQSQTEISRLKNINKICMGKSIIDTWYQ